MSTTAPDARTRITNGANWFYWVAGLSVINSLVAHNDSGFNFVVGLGITQLFDGITAGTAAAPLALAIDALLLGTCALVGYYARISQGVYVTGMVLYTLDTLLFLLFRDPLGLGFHVYALYSMYCGVRAFADLPAPVPASSEPAASHAVV
jgi:hypothetical protein